MAIRWFLYFLIVPLQSLLPPNCSSSGLRVLFTEKIEVIGRELRQTLTTTSIYISICAHVIHLVCFH